MLAKHCPKWKAILHKRPPFELRHDPRRQKRGQKTQGTIKQEICGEPSRMLLKVEQHRQEPEEQLTETEKQKNKNRESPSSPNSLRAHKNGLHSGFPQRS